MHDREIDQVVATRQPVRGEVPFAGTQGRRIYDYIMVPVVGENGQVEAVAGTTRDVTERKLAADRLRENEERLRFMAESMPVKIFTADPHGVIDYLNRQWIEFTGISAKRLGDWNWEQILHPDDIAENRRLWLHSVETGEPFQMMHRFRRSDGVYRWHLSRARAMCANDGRIMMWIGSNTDIHQQKSNEEELRRANFDLEQFAYTATHDLQEPLRGVKIYSELLARRYASAFDEQGLELLGYLQSGASRMEMLVRDLLSYTRAGRLETPAEMVEAEQCLASAVANLTQAISESGVDLVVSPLPSLPVHGTHLQQLFQNLIGNAIKYRSEERSPVVQVSAKRGEGHWVFSVSDNGIGIAPEYQERIFGLFKRLHSEEEYSGTGIGLAICKRIVEHYQGRIWVRSESGVGSAFCFTLPL